MSALDKLPSWYSGLVDTRKLPPVGAYNAPAPPMFVFHGKSKKATVKSQEDGARDLLKVKKAWEIALAPAKALPMNVFMSYMSGNSLQMIPLTMTFYMFFMGPMRQLLVVNQQFENLRSPANQYDIFITKMVYVGCHILFIAYGVWKLGQMGLLPNTRSDWLAWEVPAAVQEVYVS